MSSAISQFDVRSASSHQRPESDNRIVTREECLQLVDRITQFARGGGGTNVIITSWWAGELRWARNQVSLTSDRRNIQVVVRRVVNQSLGQAWTNQLDDISLESTVRAAERMGGIRPGTPVSDFSPPAPELPTPTPLIWSDRTYSVTARMRGELARLLSEGAEAQKMLSAGFLKMYGAARSVAQTGAADGIANSGGDAAAAAGDGDTSGSDAQSFTFQQYTMGECSMTVRHPKGLGSGWAGLSSYDWASIDGAALASRALDKCLRSLNPVAIEPGRYTVVLEPQAVYELIVQLIRATRRNSAEAGQGPFVLSEDKELRLFRTKLGLKVVDERITIRHTPEDPQLGILAQPALLPVTWIEHGILTTLTNDRQQHALPKLNDNLPSLARSSFTMSGGPTSIEEMLSTTKRGLLVTRFANVMQLDGASVLCTGLTRDGLWLIENGKISKAVKNMRFTESPLFVLNNVDQLGVPVPVFTQQRNEPTPAIIPPVKANDFSFTSMVDAV